MPIWEIQRLSREHNREPFDCGQPMLDDWLKQQAGQFDRKDLARTFVAVRPDNVLVLGFYSLSNHRVAPDTIPAAEAKGLPRLDVPVALLGRLAVDRSMQGQGLGALLLVDALRRTQHLADQIGIRAVEVDAIDDAAQRFYLKFGFMPLLDNPRHLFMPMRAIRKLNLPPLW